MARGRQCRSRLLGRLHGEWFQPGCRGGRCPGRAPLSGPPWPAPRAEAGHHALRVRRRLAGVGHESTDADLRSSDRWRGRGYHLGSRTGLYLRSISFTDSWNAGGSLPEQCVLSHRFCRPVELLRTRPCVWMAHFPGPAGGFGLPGLRGFDLRLRDTTLLGIQGTLQRGFGGAHALARREQRCSQTRADRSAGRTGRRAADGRSGME
mmetsp:Transcript_67683/g.148505  ORF Transcript_67683/g.148505 Transcript_67683/m.148505 type:complete len:207 (-) Transcript_67683:831-1451(-)